MGIFLNKQERAEVLAAHNGVCDNCGKPHRRLEAHHTDYTEKPNVILCPSCHKAWHREHPKFVKNALAAAIKLTGNKRLHV